MSRTKILVRNSFLSAFLLCISLAGFSQQVTLTASMGTASGSFTTLKGAFDDINAGIHRGAIVIMINASTNETATVQLYASGSGSASYTSINIYPTASGVSITGDLAAPLIDLRGADNVTIDGRVNATGSTKSLTISNTSTTNIGGTSTIRFINDATSNTVKFSTLKGSTTANDGGIVYFSSASSVGNDNNTIDNNDMTCAGTNRPFNTVYALGSLGYNNDNNTISNNNIYNFLSTTIASKGINIVNYNSGYTISRNSFYETTSLVASGHSAPYYVISINAVGGTEKGFTISGNYIGGSAARCAGTPWTKTNAASENNGFYAISVTTAAGTASSIQGNIIQNISWTNKGGSNFYGIEIAGSTSGNVGTTAGNTIGAATGIGSIQFTGGAATSNFMGIITGGTGIIDCRNNIIGSITTASTSSTHQNNITGIQHSSSGRFDCFNNIIGSTTTAGSINANATSTTQNQIVTGLRNAGTGTASIAENIVANMINGTTAGSSQSGFIVGIVGAPTSRINTISGNTIRDLSISNNNPSVSNSASVTGIFVISNTGYTQTVSGNMVYNLSNSNVDFSGGVTGIYFRGTSASSIVSANFIHSLSVTGASSTNANLYGIKIDAGTTTYSNNIISLGGNTTTNVYGIFETGASGTTNSLYFNTVYISGNLSSGAANTSYALYSNPAVNTRDFRNNVLVNARSTASGASRHYALFAVSGGTLTCDYNQYYVSGTGGVLGDFAGDKTTSVIVTGQDANSMATNPAFINTGTSASEYAPTVPGTGITGTGITTDYAGNTRGATVSMGAIDGNSWIGSTNTDWTTASNWSLGTLPVAGSIVNIPSGRTNYPALADDRTISSLTLASGASFSLNGKILTITANLNNAGSITGAGKLTMGGSSAQTISGTGTVSNLEINNSAGVAITSGAGNMLTLTGKLTPTTGTLTTNGNLTLRSNATGTARVGAGSASGGYISGNVITQRHLTRLTGIGRNGRAWRLVTIPVTGTGTLRDVFMAGQPGTDLTVSGNRSAQPNDLGTVVIGHNQPDAATATGAGYDWIGTANQVSSLRYYQPNATSGSFASSQVPVLTTTYTAADQGYMIFSRGDRQQEYNGTGNASTTTLQATGTLKQGTINVTIPALSSAGFVLVGNPYMAVLDLEQVILDNAGVIDNTVYVWDANIDGNSFKQGAYRAVTRTTPGTWTITGTSITNPQYIESGSAFFVKPSSSGGTLSIKEAHKVDGTPGIAPHATMTDGPSRLFINLEVTDTANRRLVDGAVAFFDDNYKDGLGDPVDIAPMTNITAGSVTLRHTQGRLSMEGRPWPADSAARNIPVDMRNLGDDAYVLRILPTNMSKEGFAAWLKDRHLNKETSLKLDAETLYPFRRTGDLGIDSSRFEIVYRLSKPTNAGTLTPDDAAGEIGPRLYPNPARSADVKLSLGSLAPGRYEVQVLDISGQLVQKKTIEHISVYSEYRLLQGRKSPPGQYVLIISSDGRPLHTLPLILH